jgi:hypothetical protein
MKSTMADKVTKEQVYAILGKYLAGELKEHTGHIDGFCRQPRGKDDKLWVAHPPGNIECLGESRIIVISQKTGEILADTTEGE